MRTDDYVDFFSRGERQVIEDDAALRVDGRFRDVNAHSFSIC